ncbi:MAG: DUF4190 domain-containing protein [Actinomycetota bacterium]|nr:DUF4190 domain-containing protein [Actinomycetota bacterium]
MAGVSSLPVTPATFEANGHAPPSTSRPTQGHPAPASNADAIAALTLGVVGVTSLVLSFGLLVPLSLPCSILAWVFGLRGKDRSARGETHEGRSQAQAGLVLGRVGVALGALALIAWATMVSWGFWLDLIGPGGEGAD